MDKNKIIMGILSSLLLTLILFLSSQYFRSAEIKANKALIISTKNKEKIIFNTKMFSNIEKYMEKTDDNNNKLLDKMNVMEKEIIKITYKNQIVKGYKIRKDYDEIK